MTPEFITIILPISILTAVLLTFSLMSKKESGVSERTSSRADAESGPIKNEIIKILIALKSYYYKNKMREIEKLIAAAGATHLSKSQLPE